MSGTIEDYKDDDINSSNSRLKIDNLDETEAKKE
jgi:hypothetical protein